MSAAGDYFEESWGSVPDGAGWIDRIHPDLQYRPDTLMALTGARRWITLFRSPSRGKLDIQATADNMGVPVTLDLDEMSPHGITKGLFQEDGELTIQLRPDLRDGEKRLTMGHEMGHIFLWRALGYVSNEFSATEENFCEEFGREVALPVGELSHIEAVEETTILELMKEHGVSLQCVVFQLMKAGKLPQKIGIDSRIGSVENPEYAYKACRNYLCRACEMNGSLEVCRPAAYEIPTFDFTDREWSGMLPTCIKEPNYHFDKKLFHALNEHYGPRPAEQLTIEGI